MLGRHFFDRDARTVAKNLIGMFLVRRHYGKEAALMITETEAYAGPEDLASHARFGKTARTAPMFGPPGTIYVYFTYGMHWMFNIACGEEGEPSAALIRAAGEYVGPARLTKALGIEGSLSGKPLGKASGLWIENCGVMISPRTIRKTPRIGVAHAGKWAAKPWRYVLKEAPRPIIQRVNRRPL